MLRELQFKYLSKRHADDIYRFSLAVLGSHADAQDATQEVLIKLWERLPLLNVRRMKSWLMTTTRNYCLDHIKKRNRSETLWEGADQKNWEPDEGDGVTPEVIHDQELLMREVADALATLPAKHREAFVLHEINGMKYQTIAEHLDMPINSVKVYISRARTKLQKALRKESKWIESYSNGVR